MPDTVATRTHCPTCGARLARPDLSICAYCTAPLGLEEKSAEPSEIVRRLERMKEHERYAGALAWDPPPQLEDLDATAAASRGLALVGLSVPLLLLAVVWGLVAGAATAAWPVWIPAGLLLVAGAALMVSGRVRTARARAHPLMKRPALVVSRRSETSVRARGHRTVYYFQLELGDGSAGEFAYPGRGTSDDLLVAGNTGIAYTRRQNLVAFRSIRV